jgi:hypothetical protein
VELIAVEPVAGAEAFDPSQNLLLLSLQPAELSIGIGERAEILRD